MAERIQSYEAFFPYYLREHSEPATRAFHYFAAFASIACLVWAVALGPLWVLLLMPVVGYGPAWIAHGFIERNKPATFTYPLWSLISDYKMTWLWMTGRLGRHLEQAGVTGSRGAEAN